jgi:biotin carboxyl carrier protein
MEDFKLYDDEPKPIPEEELESFQVGESEYITTLHDKYKNRKPYEPVNLFVIRAVIPGVIRKHYVKEGAKVKKGDKLLVLEAMKMKNDILTTESGIVEEICVKIGERVPKDTILVKIK